MDDDQYAQAPPTRTTSYFDEVMSVSDAQLQISNYMRNSHSKSSLKIALNYLTSLIKSGKPSKMMLIVDSKIVTLMIPLILDPDTQIRTIVLQLFTRISVAFTYQNV